MPRVVLGLPMYRAEASVAAALESLLAQDYDDFAIVAIDDCSPDSTLAIAQEYARAEPRLVVEANSERLGMIGNWNRVLARARELHPDMEFFAWASDNDLRDPAWVSSLVRALDDQPDAVLAYSRFGRVEGEVRTEPPARIFETRGIDRPFARLRATIGTARAGMMIWGLQRQRPPELGDGVPGVLVSDRLFLTHLALYGTFVQEPRVLFYRRIQATAERTPRRQRVALFADGAPWSAFLPISLQHTVWLVRQMVFGRRRPAGLGRAQALGISVFYLCRQWTDIVRHRSRRFFFRPLRHARLVARKRTVRSGRLATKSLRVTRRYWIQARTRRRKLLARRQRLHERELKKHGKERVRAEKREAAGKTSDRS